jgi:hypothetical protein
MSTTTSDSLERLSHLRIGSYSHSKEPFIPYFSKHELPKPLKLGSPTIYQPNMMKLDPQTERNVLSPKKHETGSVRPLSKQATAEILKTKEMV